MTDGGVACDPEPLPSVLRIAPYVPGASGSASGQRTVHKLSSNEAPHGPSPRARAAFADAAAALSLYPDGSASALRTAIGAAHGLDPARIVCGSGSDELLGLLTRLYVRPGNEALMPQHAFLMYRLHTLACGGVPVLAPDRGLGADVDGLLAAVTPRTRIVFLANPNNPTGTCLSADEVTRLADGMPGNVLLVLDAAYAEYVTRDDYDAGAGLAATRGNVVMVRTFSKVYGLAALRIGWLYGPAAVVDVVNRIRGPFNVSGPALAAGVAAVQDRAHVADAVRFNSRWRATLAGAIRDMGYAVTPSEGNFLLIHFPRGAAAADADAFLNARGFVLHPLKPYGLPDALRLSIGTAEANEGVIAALAAFRADATATSMPGAS